MMALQPLMGGEKSSSEDGFTDDSQLESSESSLVPVQRVMVRTAADGNRCLQFEEYHDPACVALLMLS
jgi:hypothetical protein